MPSFETDPRSGRLIIPENLESLHEINSIPELRLFFWSLARKDARAWLKTQEQLTKGICIIGITGASIYKADAEANNEHFDFPVKPFGDDIINFMGTPRGLYRGLMCVHATEPIVKKFRLPALLDGLLTYINAVDPKDKEGQERYRRFVRSWLNQHGWDRNARKISLQLRPPDKNDAMQKIIDDMAADLKTLARRYRHKRQVSAEQSLFDARSGLFEASMSYLKSEPSVVKMADDVFDRKLPAYLNLVAERKMVDNARQETPELAKEYKRQLKRNSTEDKLERLDLLEKVKEDFYSVDMGKDATRKRRFELVEAEVEDEEGDTHSAEEDIEDTRHFDSDGTYADEDLVERRRILKEAIAEAKLSDRERIVAELKLLKGKTDEQVAATLRDRLGKPFAEPNVRQLASRATKKIAPIARGKLRTD